MSEMIYMIVDGIFFLVNILIGIDKHDAYRVSLSIIYLLFAKWMYDAWRKRENDSTD